jgi:hypothetical protein
MITWLARKGCPSALLLTAMLANGCANDKKTVPEVRFQQSPAPRSVQAPKPHKPTSKELSGNVVGVCAMYDPFTPWIWDNENRMHPYGLVIRALYLRGPEYKGVFGDGTIRPKLFIRELNEKGEVNWKLAKEWAFTPDDAYPFRSRTEKALGWGYRFDLNWKDLAKYEGQQIRLIVEYDRSDGRKIVSEKKDFRVPLPNVG